MHDSLPYWERRRVAYNLVLIALTAAYVIRDWHHGEIELTAELAAYLAVYAILANVAYCVAYVADVLFVVTGRRQLWQRWRAAAFYGGLLLAAVTTCTVLTNISDDML